MSQQNQDNAHDDISIKNFKYQLVLSAKTRYNFTTFAFNTNNTILFVGCKAGTILIYGLNNLKKHIQSLTYRTALYTNCLIFANKFNSLIFVSNDKLIKIRNFNQKLKQEQELQGHTSYIYCMILNKEEDLLISGSGDNTIKFWIKYNQTWNCQQSVNTQVNVRCLSLNFSETKLIICGHGNYIQVIEKLLDKQWVINQTIKGLEGAYRVSFTNDNQFIIQPKTLELMEIYNYEEENKQFIKIKHIKVQSCFGCYYKFPSQFIQEKQILSMKHGPYVNLFKCQNDNYQLQQSIFFNTYTLFGGFIRDGCYSATWDYNSKKIQIRQLQIKD